MDVQIAVSACHGAMIVFQEPEVGLEFIKMVLGLIQPEQFLSYINATATAPEAIEQAQEFVTRCMGVPS
jgi:hypothetical protein